VIDCYNLKDTNIVGHLDSRPDTLNFIEIIFPLLNEKVEWRTSRLLNVHSRTSLTVGGLKFWKV